MKTIKFRAKDAATGKWVYGFYYNECEHHYIIENRQEKNFLHRNEAHPIVLETLGQFTGFFDGNGKEIYEHDLFEDFPHTLEVVFEKGAFRIIEYDMQGKLVDGPSYDPLSRYIDLFHSDRVILKVIDNKFDNKLRRISV